jgi:hypothetical protein
METTIADDAFGSLTWDGELHVWRGASQLPDNTPFELCIETVSYLTNVPPFDDATWDRTITDESRRAFARVLAAESGIRAAIATDLMPDYSPWNNGEAADSGDISKRLGLERITLLPQGEVQIQYDDGDMFGGHDVVGHLDVDGHVTRVELFG